MSRNGGFAQYMLDHNIRDPEADAPLDQPDEEEAGDSEPPLDRDDIAYIKARNRWWED